MKTVPVNERNAPGMGTVTNAESITENQSTNGRWLVKRNNICPEALPRGGSYMIFIQSLLLYSMRRISMVLPITT